MGAASFAGQRLPPGAAAPAPPPAAAARGRAPPPSFSAGRPARLAQQRALLRRRAIAPAAERQPLYGVRWQRGAAAPAPGARRGARRGAPAPSASAAAAAAAAAAPAPDDARPAAVRAVAGAVASVRAQLAKLDGLWHQFIPMSTLFFLMAFVNTVIDSLKDSLVITAAGGGTRVLPFLTAYAVLPSSLAFLVAYSWGTRRWDRARLFEVIVAGFLVALAAFAFAYPHADALHLGAALDPLAARLPLGLAGGVGMLRNWTFTAFYCVSELWGDVVLSLLFWGLANETTSLEDAPLLYPLFGVGANVAQTAAGRVLRLFSGSAGTPAAYAPRLQALLALCVGLGAAILALHAYIVRALPANPKGAGGLRARQEAAAAAAARAAAAAEAGRHRRLRLDLEAAVAGLNYCDVEAHKAAEAAAARAAAAGRGRPPPPPPADAPSPDDAGRAVAAAQAPRRRGPKRGMGLREAFAFLRASPQIRCLALMALAQGITTSLLDLAWKHHLHALHPSPAAYSAFLGDVAMWTGVVTGSLMFASPALFDRLGWRGVAAATPNIMLAAGAPFFAGCIAFHFWLAGALPGAAPAVLLALVVAGALLQVFSRGAKFSLFKPAEEMVYIGLDDESRSKGKAAIDVVGAQAGKSAGSLLQQALLLACAGSVGAALPVMAVAYLAMLLRWRAAVDDLAEHHDPAHAHRLSVMGSLDEDLLAPPEGGAGEAGEGARATPVPA